MSSTPLTTVVRRPSTDVAGRPAMRSRQEIRALTGLRIVAAMWVVLFHFEGQLRPYVDQIAGAHAILGSGWIGVELFFVLSGFVIARSYLEECGRRWSTAGALRFVLNRFARVWPAFMAVTALAIGWLVVAPHLGLRTDVVGSAPPVALAPILRQVTMTHMWGADSLGGVSYVAPGWSISAEWLAYLAFPLLALAMRPLLRLHPAVNLVLAVAVMLPLSIPSFLYGTDDIETNWVLRITCSFLAGILASCAVQELPRTARTDLWGMRLTAGSLVATGSILLWANWRTEMDLAAGGDVGKYALTAVVCWPLLVAGLSLTDRGPARLLSRDTLVYGGRISYCLYLVHWPVREIGMAVIGRNEGLAGALTPGGALAVPALIAASLLLAAAFHHGVEEPARRRLVRLWGDRRAVAAEPAQPAAPDEHQGTARWQLDHADGAATRRPPVTGAVAAVGPPRPRSGVVLVGQPRASDDGRVLPTMR